MLQYLYVDIDSFQFKPKFRLKFEIKKYNNKYFKNK